ncbi:MAG: protease inhibitor I42 family protein [Hymenobacteraceae bacterium]|nr:protease inhibitor I42 family protein [Hymenobacteraceae bacterium]
MLMFLATRALRPLGAFLWSGALAVLLPACAGSHSAAVDSSAAAAPTAAGPSTPPAVTRPAVPAPVVARSSMHTLTQGDSGRATKLAPGDTLLVALDENPTTGYSWAVATAPSATTLRAVSNAYTPTVVADSVVGSGGVRRLCFVAVAPGATRLALRYHRRWEPASVAPARTFEVQIVVR